MIVNRLPVVNFESSFNPNASNGIARGYVQTLKKWNVGTSITDQLTRMVNRMEHQKTVGTCSHRTQEGDERLLRCLYARHF